MSSKPTETETETVTETEMNSTREPAETAPQPDGDADHDHEYQPGERVFVTIAERNDAVSHVTVEGTVSPDAAKLVVTPADSGFIDAEVRLPIGQLIETPIRRDDGRYRLPGVTPLKSEVRV